MMLGKNKPISKHHEVGQVVGMNGKRWMIMAYCNDNVVLCPLDEPGPVVSTQPAYMGWKRSDE